MDFSLFVQFYFYLKLMSILFVQFKISKNNLLSKLLVYFCYLKLSYPKNDMMKLLFYLLLLKEHVESKRQK